MNNEKDVYFQTQQKLSNECGLHALNNMLGEHIFDCLELNKICGTLSNNLINPHKHIFGGDYDVNILIIALQGKGYQCTWIDSRKKSEINATYLNQKQAFGYLINKQSINKSIFKKVLGFSGRHWISVRRINDRYFLLDSKRQKPQVINCLQKFIAIEMEMGSHIIEVFNQNSQNI